MQVPRSQSAMCHMQVATSKCYPDDEEMKKGHEEMVASMKSSE